MNARRRAVWSLAVAIVAANARPAPAAEDTNRLVRAVSVSGQFVAYAASPLLPFAACVFAEQVKREWRDRLDLADAWRDPILILINAPPVAPAARHQPVVAAFRTELHRKYQITCPTPLEPGSLVTALVEALCAEFANRDRLPPPGQTAQLEPRPLWLVHGLAQSVQGRNEMLVAAARRSLAAGRPQTALTLLSTTAEPDDATERQLLEANFWLFTESLASLPQGARKLQQCLIQAAAAPSATNAFWSVYAADFPRVSDLEKWWGVQLAERVHLRRAENLTLAEAAGRLDQILDTTLVRHQRGTTNRLVIGLKDLGDYDAQPWLKEVLQDKIRRLDALRSAAVPCYRPVISAYIQALVWLADHKLARFWRTLKHAAAARAAAARQAQQISAQLDQAEQVYAPQDLANSFSNFFQTFEQLDAIQQQRHSPISDYLDQFER